MDGTVHCPVNESIHTVRLAIGVARDGHGLVQSAFRNPADPVGVNLTVIGEEFGGSKMFRRSGERDLITWLAPDAQSAHSHSR